jgi:hypothetical protein
VRGTVCFVDVGACELTPGPAAETWICPTYATQQYCAYQYLVRQANTGTSTAGDAYYFTQPSLFKYGAGQWLWDSCGAIIANVHRDVDDAILEFRTLMNAQVGRRR